MPRRRLGLCSITALDRPLAEVARAAAEAGLDGVEVTARPPHLEPEADVAAARTAGRAVRDAGCEVLAYGSYFGHGGALDAERAAREVERAEALGTELLRVWAEPPADAPDAFDTVVRALRAAGEAAAGAGVTVVVERHIGSFADSAERAERLLDAVGHDRVRLNYQALDFLEPAAAGEQPADAKRLGGLAAYCHLKNYTAPADPGGRLGLGGSLLGGALDYRAILPALFETGYAGPLAIEFLPFTADPFEAKLASEVADLGSILAEIGAP